MLLCVDPELGVVVLGRILVFGMERAPGWLLRAFTVLERYPWLMMCRRLPVSALDGECQTIGFGVEAVE